jgi:hypothetical protein
MQTVWRYRTTDEDHRSYWQVSFFYAGSDDYTGWWMGCTDCVWIVPGTTD